MSRAWPIRAIGASVLAAGALAGAGCATATAEKTAATALSHLATYERDVHAKVRAENDFYESILQDASARIIDLWKSQQPALLDEELGRFAADYLDATAEALAPACRSSSKPRGKRGRPETRNTRASSRRPSGR